MSAPVAIAAGSTQEHASPTARSPVDPGAGGPEPADLTTVPQPGPGQSTIDLAGAMAGGLTAQYAEWRVDGGEVLLTGSAPFVDLSGRAGFRSDGTLDGQVAMRACVRLLGLQVAVAEWTVAGWTAQTPLAAPAVTLRGTTLAIELAGIGAEVALSATEGFAATRQDTSVAIALPDGALPAGRPLEPRVVELFRGLRGWDVSGLRTHPDAAVEHAPAFVSDKDLFFAPSRYGVDSPETAALLDAAVRAALAGLVGPVEPTPAAPPAQPAPDAPSPTEPDTTLVPATVPPTPAVVPTPTGTEPGAPVEGGGAPVEGGGTPTGIAVTEETSPVPASGVAAPEPAQVELLMPPAPAAPGPAARARMGAVGGGAGRAARAAGDLPPASTTAAQARGAVTEPAAETAARAREGLAASLGSRPAPSPEIVALSARIRTAIRAHRPVDEKTLLGTDPTKEAKAAGATVSGSVKGQVDEVHAGYDALGRPPGGAPALTPTPVQAPSAASPEMGVNAASAAPDAIPPKNLSLDGDVSATDQRITSSGVDTRVTRQIPSAPFSTARDARGELGEMAKQTPEQLATQQAAAISTAQTDMAALQEKATQALLTSRSGTVGDVTGRQSGMVSSEQQTRESVGTHAQQVFETARTQVTTLLDPLTRTAMARWEAGLAELSQAFHDALDRVQSWITQRHSGIDGYVVALGDAVFGLPDWVIDAYNRAEEAFGDKVADLLLDISTDVNGVVAAAQAVIAQARDDIDAMFTAMEAEFPEWVAQERARFSGMLDGLSQSVTQAQTSFVRDVSQRAAQAVAEAQTAVEERREAARGVIGRIAAAIQAFIDDPVTAIINGLLTLAHIPPPAFWALVARIQQVAADIANDPETFVNNLVAGLRQGFQLFFDNFGTHVLGGFWAWLFSGLKTPIPMPKEFSPRALFTFALQLMGITWPRVREILVKHVGEKNVAIIEAAWELISVLIERGPEGLVEMVKERLSPEVLVQSILEAAVEYIVETLIKQVVVRVIGMLNPVGAVAQAIDLIYRVCAWVFRNAARIFRFVETVVNGMADVIAGNVAGLAKAVERSLASLIPPVIDFLAGLAHLEDLPSEVAARITKFQAQVLQVMDLIIGTIVERVQAMLKSLGLGGEKDKKGADSGDEELGTTVRFSAAGKSHRVWVETAGTDATLMVASVPESIESKIAEWRGRVSAGEPQDDALRAEASTTLGNLETVANEANEEGDRLAVLYIQAAADKSDDVKAPSDDALENRERAIAGMLNRLFTIFEGHEATARWLADMAALLPGQGSTRMGWVYEDWQARISQFRIGNEGQDDRLWPDNVLDGTRAGADSVIASPSTHQLLLPYFQTAPGKRSVNEPFYEYVFSQTGASHSVRRRFRQAYGNPAVSNLTTGGLAAIASTTKVDDETKDRWRTRLTRMRFDWDSPGGGRIDWPTERIPDHTRYRPIVISQTEDGGVRTTVYRTVTGQEFTATSDSTDGLSMTVTGENLRFMSGRGVTQDSPAFRSNNGFDRSHIIANEFGGTGFATGGNLVTASSRYNQEIMRHAERTVGDSIFSFAQAHGLDDTQVSFTMTVKVAFGALRDPTALARVKKQPWFPADRAGADLDAEIAAKIHAGHVHPDLMRITSVTYQWSFTDPVGTGSALSIGADLWLLMNG